MLPTPSRSRGACSKALSSPRSWMRTSTPAQQSSLRRSHPMMRIERAPLFLNVRMGENKHGRFAQHPHPNHDFTRTPGTRLGAFARIPPLTRRYLGDYDALRERLTVTKGKSTLSVRQAAPQAPRPPGTRAPVPHPSMRRVLPSLYRNPSMPGD